MILTIGKVYLDSKKEQVKIVYEKNVDDIHRFVGDNNRLYSISGTCEDGTFLVDCIFENTVELATENNK
jgi:hypothetical protein